MAMCRPCSLERYGWLMIGMGDRGILIFVSEPLLTFFPETKSGFYVWDIIEKFGECGGLVQCRWCICDDGFLSLRVNIRIVNDSHVCFLLCDTCTIYGSIWKIQRNWFKTYFWDNLCVCEIGSYDLQINWTHPQFAYGAWGPGGFSSVNATWGGSFSSFRTVGAEIIPARWVGAFAKTFLFESWESCE